MDSAASSQSATDLVLFGLLGVLAAVAAWAFKRTLQLVEIGLSANRCRSRCDRRLVRRVSGCSWCGCHRWRATGSSR